MNLKSEMVGEVKQESYTLTSRKEGWGSPALLFWVRYEEVTREGIVPNNTFFPEKKKAGDQLVEVYETPHIGMGRFSLLAEYKNGVPVPFSRPNLRQAQVNSRDLAKTLIDSDLPDHVKRAVDTEYSPIVKQASESLIFKPQ